MKRLTYIMKAITTPKLILPLIASAPPTAATATKPRSPTKPIKGIIKPDINCAFLPEMRSFSLILLKAACSFSSAPYALTTLCAL